MIGHYSKAILEVKDGRAAASKGPASKKQGPRPKHQRNNTYGFAGQMTIAKTSAKTGHFTDFCKVVIEEDEKFSFPAATEDPATFYVQ